MSERQSSDGRGRESHRVAEELRARMADGTYPPRSFLPSQRNLAEQFGVSRDTVQRVLRELAGEGLIESRQGSGSRVVAAPSERPATGRQARPGRLALGPFMEDAFGRHEVSLDVFTLTSESLYAHIRVQAERVHNGSITPDRITLRMLLPTGDLAVPYPRVKDDKDDQRLHDRLHIITQRATESLRSLLRDLETERLVSSVDLQIRHVPLTPAFKLYLLNGRQALLAPYEVIERQITLDSGETIAALDVLGLGAALTHHMTDPADPQATGTIFVESWQAWFDSVWNHLAE